MAVLLPGKGNELITVGMASLRDGPLGLLESRFARKSVYSNWPRWIIQASRGALPHPAKAHSVRLGVNPQLNA